ncbi:nucleotidyltransferase domain-containing protein [Streptomyces hydrogenans]|uniref:nucleotidyltransferase domain-containing protein n=1 Tax=Streptomyces hydrogenans TaxID=1873719 RepID=UPI00342CCE63
MTGVNIADLFPVLDALRAADVPHWVAGGWGVDALVGRQTREHRDVDLAFDASCQTAAMRALVSLGYRTETDQLPARVELAAPGRRWVDLHPVVFDAGGLGRQSDLKGPEARRDVPAGVLDPEVESDGAGPALSVAVGSGECRLDPGEGGEGRRAHAIEAGDDGAGAVAVVLPGGRQDRQHGVGLVGAADVPQGRCDADAQPHVVRPSRSFGTPAASPAARPGRTPPVGRRVHRPAGLEARRCGRR